ncbi:hypothetical protein HJD18_07295 [Thermoleophilia bacterium SCSIO 60948]|nr:hypothetical protein HJD18_07295 [Thermoleophilia bacterium SCSIO 60948]
MSSRGSRLALRRRAITGLFAAVAASSFLSAAASPAVAGVGSARYESPTGTSAQPCTEQAPCDIATAINGAAGGQVLLEGGNYQLGESGLFIGGGTDVGPKDDQQVTIAATGGIGSSVRVNGDGSSIADLTIRAANANAALLLDQGSPLAERVYVESYDNTGAACSMQAGLIRDSVCFGSGAAQSNDGVAVQGFNGGTFSARLRNVTAYSKSGSGLYIGAFQAASVTVDARNSIFRGNDGDLDSPQADIESFGDGARIGDIDFSNYSSVNGPDSIAAPNSDDNQTASPVFSNEAAGDFTQAPGSPTIDAGTAAATDLGTTDLAGDERFQNGRIDIGAYEDEAPDTLAPEVRITRAPAKRTRARIATFRFTATDDSAAPVSFECRLDGRPFRPCASPRTFRGLKPGRHLFRVRGIDEAGNTSGPARYGWKILRRRR